MNNAYLIIYCGSKSVAIAETAAKARYQMFLHVVDLFGRKNASFVDIKSRLLERNVTEQRTRSPISIEYTRFKNPTASE